jgi:hypothetical protein
MHSKMIVVVNSVPNPNKSPGLRGLAFIINGIQFFGDVGFQTNHNNILYNGLTMISL